MDKLALLVQRLKTLPEYEAERVPSPAWCKTGRLALQLKAQEPRLSCKGLLLRLLKSAGGARWGARGL